MKLLYRDGPSLEVSKRNFSRTEVDELGLREDLRENIDDIVLRLHVFEEGNEQSRINLCI